MFFKKSKEIKRLKEELNKYKKQTSSKNKLKEPKAKDLPIDIELEVEITDYVNSKIGELSVENVKDPFQIEMIDNIIKYLRKFKSNERDSTLVNDLLKSFYLLKNEVNQDRIDKLLNRIPLFKKNWNETRRKRNEKSHTIDIKKHLD